jgi:RND superfamily putative drug exporter
LPFGLGESVFATASGDAVRLFVVFRDDPYDAAAIASFTALESRVAHALPAEGFGAATASWSGATPTAADAVSATETDIWRIALFAAILMSIVLMVYFRAVLAPLLLIASSALGLAASLGIFVDVFQGPLGYPDVTFFVPVTAGLLLVSLGADYSVFVMGRIWEEARGRDMRAAVEAALPRASRAVSIAAVTLAASFAVLEIVPVQAFREFAFIMSAGVLIDAFVVRTLLLPALLVLAGPRAFWPHRSSRKAVPGPVRQSSR